MDFQASKKELLKTILDIDNTAMIQRISEFIKREKADFWNELSIEEQNEIQQGMSDLKKGDKIEFNEFLKRIG
ncbi:MAG: hypothetical protein N4A45_06000 [Flavobacteriales bacterium]|jgi:hypothetical protein|nr:hypothetical protein [Flavobacteriales bacterium]